MGSKINDGVAGGRGLTYEARFCMLFAVRGYMRGLNSFQLRYQVSEADKFDDIVFDEGGEIYQVFQLKHKEKESKVFHSHLFNETFNTDYNLLKYVKSLIEVKLTKQFDNKIKAAVLITNNDFGLYHNKLSLVTNLQPGASIWYDGLTSLQLVPCTLDKSNIFDISNLFSDAKYYTFQNIPQIEQILKRQATMLAEEIRNNPKWQNGKDEKQREKLKKQEDATIRELENLDEVEIRDALQYIVYAVHQPNDKEVEEIIKTEIKEYFKLQNPDTIYNELEKIFRGWCETKEALILNQTSSSNQPSSQKQHVISFKDVEKIFQKNIKNVSFGVTSPTSSFTGRVKELQTIGEKLKEASDLIVSQTVAISGLGGIGKTELTKQFIKEFGQSHFYGRVIWVEAANDESVKKSFERLAERLEIVGVTRKVTTTIIDEVFAYFEGFKVLFVFDNFDKTPSNKENLIVHCRKIASDSTKEHRPYFLFTSRNKDCLSGVSSLDLSVLTKKDASDLIVKGLTNNKIKNTKEEVEELAETLQYFPLALRQTIAYISEQHKIQNVSGARYDIQDYLIEFDKEKEKLLDYQFPDDFGQNEKTTLITWNVTLDAIKANRKDGENAIKVLKLLAYLYADKIDSKMFLPLFENDSNCNGRAFLLLEKYSLITKLDEKTSFYQIHRLVQAIVQLKFKENEEEILEQVIKLIYPELYEYYFVDSTMLLNTFDVLEQCTTDKLLHFNNLAIHRKKHKGLENKFSMFFQHFYDGVCLKIMVHDDINEIKGLYLSEKDLKDFIKRYIGQFIKLQSNNVIKYIIENKYWELNERISDKDSDNQLLIKRSLDTQNLNLFKFFIEKGADFGEFLDSAPVELISDIINGKSVSLQKVISDQSDITKSILGEALFFATLFNQESIVNILMDIDADPDFEFSGWSPIFAAAMFDYTNILEIFLQKCHKETLKRALFRLAYHRYFDNKDIFKIILNRYLQLGGAVNDQDDEGNSLFCKLSYRLSPKQDIIQFLLDEGADPTLTNIEGENALVHIIIHSIIGFNRFTDNNDIYNKLCLSEMSPGKFITVITKGLFKIKDRKKYDINKGFNDLLNKIGDINVRNSKGETLLINYVQDVDCKIENVKLLVENGADVDAIDNDRKNAQNHAVELKKYDISIYLLRKSWATYFTKYCSIS